MTLQGMVQWGQNNVAVVDSADAFNDLVTGLEAGARYHPFMIDIIAADGRSLALGVGRDKTVLSLAGAKGSPQYYASVGDENAEGEILFDYFGQRTDFRLRHAVPISAARTAAVQFLSGSGLPDAVRWRRFEQYPRPAGKSFQPLAKRNIARLTIAGKSAIRLSQAAVQPTVTPQRRSPEPQPSRKPPAPPEPRRCS